MTTQVFIGNLAYETSERAVEEFLRGYGEICDIIMKKGFAFVEFTNMQDAEDAVTHLNGTNLSGNQVTVQFVRSKEQRKRYFNSRGRGRGQSGSYSPCRTFRVVVENLSSRVSWQDLKDYMRQAGRVTYGDAHKMNRNEGVVDFATEADMENAIEKLNNTELNGRRLRLSRENRAHTVRLPSRSSFGSARTSYITYDVAYETNQREDVVQFATEAEVGNGDEEYSKSRERSLRLIRENIDRAKLLISNNPSPLSSFEAGPRRSSNSPPRSSFGSAREVTYELIRREADVRFATEADVGNGDILRSRSQINNNSSFGSRSCNHHDSPPQSSFGEVTYGVVHKMNHNEKFENSQLNERFLIRENVHTSRSHLSSFSFPRFSYRSRSPLRSHKFRENFIDQMGNEV